MIAVLMGGRGLGVPGRINVHTEVAQKRCYFSFGDKPAATLDLSTCLSMARQ
jgi:hypothetical protein